MQTIAFMNMKGGVGKTTLVVNVAYGLATLRMLVSAAIVVTIGPYDERIIDGTVRKPSPVRQEKEPPSGPPSGSK